MQNMLQVHGHHGFSGFELTAHLLRNLHKWDLTPNAKLVLLYLSSCYNPKKAHVFPKQATIASAIGISERSANEGISRLIKAGLLLSERKYTNRYKFTSKIVCEPPENEYKNISENNRKIFLNNTQNFRVHEHEQIKEKINLAEDEYLKLEKFALSKGARNPKSYVNALIKNGQAENILKDIRQSDINSKVMNIETQRILKQSRQDAQNSKPWEEMTRDEALDFALKLPHFSKLKHKILSKFE